MRQKVIVLGGSGLVGCKFIELNKDYFDLDAPDEHQVDLLNQDVVKKYLNLSPAGVVVNFAAYTNVDEAEKQKDQKNGLVYQLNTEAVKNLASLCADGRKYLIQISTDYVFDGTKEDNPYREEDIPHPTNWYGMTKYLGEQVALATNPNTTIVRIEMPFSSHYDLKRDIGRFFLDQLKNGREIDAVSDQKVTPVLVDDVALTLRRMIDQPKKGIFHAVSTTWTTPFEMAVMIAEEFFLDKSLIKPVKLSDYNQTRPVKRPQNLWLDTHKFENTFGKDVLHTLKESIAIFHSYLV